MLEWLGYLIQLGCGLVLGWALATIRRMRREARELRASRDHWVRTADGWRLQSQNWRDLCKHLEASNARRARILPPEGNN